MSFMDATALELLVGGSCGVGGDVGLCLSAAGGGNPSLVDNDGAVDADGDVADEAVGHDAAELLDVKGGEVAVVVGDLEDLERVLPVACAAATGEVGDGVGVVGPDLVHHHVEFVIEEELAGVDESAGAEGAVGEGLPVVVDLDVDVGGAAGVVTGEDAGELCDTVPVGGERTTEPLLVGVCAREGGQQTLADAGLSGDLVLEVRCGVGVARVVAGGVCVPEVDEDVGDWLAGVYVDDADVHLEVHAELPFGHVGADGVVFGVIVGALGGLGGEDAGGVADLGLDDGVARHDALPLLLERLDALCGDLAVDAEIFKVAVDEEVLVLDRVAAEHLLCPRLLACGSHGSDGGRAVVGSMLLVEELDHLVLGLGAVCGCSGEEDERSSCGCGCGGEGSGEPHCGASGFEACDGRMREVREEDGGLMGIIACPGRPAGCAGGKGSRLLAASAAAAAAAVTSFFRLFALAAAVVLPPPQFEIAEGRRHKAGAEPARISRPQLLSAWLFSASAPLSTAAVPLLLLRRTNERTRIGDLPFWSESSRHRRILSSFITQSHGCACLALSLASQRGRRMSAVGWDPMGGREGCARTNVRLEPREPRSAAQHSSRRCRQ
ncbi:hypothetical protein L1887_57287 [Cichorium endivia]|nr:hypothetical protein L1887_57287 [Cichorium endivia]